MSNRHALVFLWIVVLLAAGRLQAALWTGGGDNLSWSDPANWEAAGVPEAGAAVTNAAGAILLANATAELASFTMTGGTLTFTNWTTCLRATNVVLDGGIVTLPPPFTETQMSNRVWIACTDFTLAAGAVIDADAKGYQGLNGPGKGEGYDTHSSGGGHGGRGGRGSYNKKPGLVYDDMAAPLFPGSGGGVKFKTEPTAHGGGVIRIDAVGLVTVDGTITADGLMTPKDHRDGGGSGGAIWISSQRFGGAETGRISARGGNGGTFGGGGGGGRIAIHYQQLSEPARMRLSAARGDNNYDVNLIDTKEPFACTDGTIWLSDARLLTVPLLSGTFERGVVWVPGFTEWAQESLVVSNASLAIGNPGMAITITNDLRIESGELRVGAGDERAELSIGGNLVLTNSGSLAVVSGTNTVDGYGACLGVAGDLLLASGSWIRPYSHPTEGGSVRMTARNLMIAAGGGINADNRGFHGQQGPGTGVNVWHDAGGSYGGRGELGTAGNASKPVYGSIDAPDQPGSGGGHGGSSGAQGGGVRAAV
ncbi:MAG: hypothetical protein GX590_03530 [Lentisphaerae bacterium]|nr:hypothetical protein [Lentisphaerota bacterium]